MSLHWLVPALCLIFGSKAQAWDQHAIPTFLALSEMEFFKKAPLIPAEPFDSFLQIESARIEKTLTDEEEWAREFLREFPPLPTNLKFKSSSLPTSPASLRTAFLKAIRIQPQSKLGLYLQRTPGRAFEKYPTLRPSEVSLISEHQDLNLWVAIQPKQPVSPLDILVTAVDEPDLGIDIGLWEDNPGVGTEYGFGKQPFGNPSLSYSGQAPFHMGFFHENPLIYALASFTQRTYPEMRVHQWTSLARFAFENGHPYWGWRFLGWALHYIQDLTQPYHSTLLPGVSLAQTLGINFLYEIGIRYPKQQMIQLITNEHLAFEHYHLELLSRLMKKKTVDPLIRSLQDPQEDSTDLHAHPLFLREIVAKSSYDLARQTHLTLSQALPARWVKDPNYVYGKTDPHLNILAEIAMHPELDQSSLHELLNLLMKDFGKYTRSFLTPFLTLSRENHAKTATHKIIHDEFQ